MLEKQFLVKDLSGRGFVSILTLADFRANWDLDYSNDPEDLSELTLGDWLADSSIGDSFNHSEDSCLIERIA
jgi:hypothetical protein